MTGLDWPSLMRAGLLGLRLPPDEFWKLTPAELSVLLGNPQVSGPLLGTGLEALMAAYPDTTREDERHDG